MSTQETESTASLYRDYARRWFPGHSELYVQWAMGLATSPELLALVSALPEHKRQPNLVFAAARFHGCPDESFRVLEAYLAAHWAGIRTIVMTHATQTNEAARCATLLPALGLVAAQEQRPLALIEVGPSAGLCLLPDLYSYSYDGAAPLGDGSPLLRCATTGNPPLPHHLPEIAWLAGVDLNPLDGTDPDTVAWLRALVWPGQEDRLERLDAALGTLAALKSGALQASAGAPLLLTGDLNERIADLVDAAPKHAVPVVMHSAVLAYLDEAQRARFADTVAALGCRWISNEAFFMDAANHAQEGPDANYFTLALDRVPLARTGPHGAELHWL
ncbi:DUF2332 domain-containing protein [Paeniglutamicibacter psychrophenolicus]|uniref:DUF2332 domain-containing protein n=1 Tax=Paeniglutamicibacter psychrophenolicus TaxID=257454 RepID=UPI002787FBF4|nr:DUF2332 domain-containing protein [Paeniglutamicibacter psychrophenolicus]MDQ0095505.1 hypothetical protein [Paeniglutamicibacter psychrophenolicus]